ncbi:MAG TPA: TIGR03619 family F420-dependent LLM class oxidoreductase [Candidatus Limnocylindrales bacterium]
MDFGIALPNFRPGSSREGIDAAAEVAEQLGWSTCWTTDHVLVDRANTSEYGRIYEAILTLAWVAGRHEKIKLGTSVIVVPPRNAIVLAKELATLDDLSGGRVIAGVGVGWNRAEFANMGMADRFKVRGAYLDETIRLWRHLWSGSTEPFRGRFHAFDDFVFEPLPAQGAALPIYVGGGSKPALERAGRLADAYHSSAVGPSKFAERASVVRAAAEAAGRPAPALTARVRVRFDEAKGEGYAMRGNPEQIAAEVRAWAAVGVTHLALWLGPRDPQGVVAAAERFAREVAPRCETR